MFNNIIDVISLYCITGMKWKFMFATKIKISEKTFDVHKSFLYKKCVILLMLRQDRNSTR